MKRIAVPSFFIFACLVAQTQGRLGINTTTPQAMLHVKDSSVLFTITGVPGAPGNPPVSGAGPRMMWYAPKASFRTGDPGGAAWDRDSVGLYSFATGFNAKAKGIYSLAAGEAVEALGGRSVAMGRDSRAIGDYSVAMGFDAVAETGYSVAIGRQVTASETGATALGYGTQARGLGSFSACYFNTAEGFYSTALGFSTHTIGQMSTTLGYDTEAEGIVSIASGYRSKSSGSYSIAGGFQSDSRSYASVALGRYNENTIGSMTTWIDTDPVLVIGDGVDDDTRSNSFSILKNGKTAINSDYPKAGLHIKGYNGTDSSHLWLEDNNSIEAGSIWFTGDMHFKNSRVGGDFYFRDNANTIILTLFSTGNMTIAGTLTQNSDASLKRDFTSLRSPLEKVLRLNGYHYYWKDGNRDPNLQTGFTAQDVEAVMPELVTTDDNGIKSVNYSGIIPYLVESIKELKKENEELKKVVTALKK
jgi:hypothetical protein